MFMTKRFVTAAAGVGLLLSLGGCPLSDPRTSNQGGGSIFSAAGKLTDGALTTLTADEVQIATDVALALAEDAPDIDPLSDSEAAALVTFLKDNGLDSLDDVQTIIENPESVVVSDEVLKALEGLIQGLESEQ